MRNTRRATCLCGQLSIEVEGEPRRINACSCHLCQARSGSAFTYTAFFAEDSYRAEGEAMIWPRGATEETPDRGYGCAACGRMVYGFMKSMPGVVTVNVGCFRDPAFPPPDRFHWSERRHHWVKLPDGVPAMIGE